MPRRSSKPLFECHSAALPLALSSASTRVKAHLSSRTLQIRLHHHYAAKIFTSGSDVLGDVIITPSTDIERATVQISLTGDAQVLNENTQTRTRSQHHFLKLDMPPSSDCPEILKAGETYEIPFRFTVPHQLLSSSCPHYLANGPTGIANHHMQLPSSMGGWEKGDMSPRVAQITYRIKASISQHRNNSKPRVEVSEVIHVLGSATELPPLNITKADKTYRLSRTVSFRKSLLSGSLGKVTATATQASAFQLYPDACGASSAETIVNLSFKESVPGIQPPEISILPAEIRAHTWFSGSPMEQLPDMGEQHIASSAIVPLMTVLKEDTPWVIAPQPDGSKVKYYTKSLRLCFDLPVSSKTFLPTFHSCLISRTYVIGLKLKCGTQNISLSIPVQITTYPIVNFEDKEDLLPSFAESRGYS